MAHAATLNGLAESLVKSITGRTPDDTAFRKLKDRTLKGLKDQSHARTNQFAVHSKLDGLVEKFAVLNRDELADALQSDLDELPTDWRWMPEILSLLLELSNRPVENTSVDDEDSTGANAEESLTWEQIIADDPFDEPDVWDDVERGYHSSGDDEFPHDGDSDPSISTKATSLDDEDSASVARLYLAHADESALADVKAAREQARSLKQNDHVLTVAELTLVRQILFMMHGLPTDMFNIDEEGRVTMSENALLSTASRSSLTDLLETSANAGTAVNFLRQWVPDSPHSYLQSIHGAIEKQVSRLSADLASLERRYIGPSGPTAVSSLKVQAEIDLAARPMVYLSSVVQRALHADAEAEPFAFLDGLYEEACVSHMAGDESVFNALVNVFLAGLATYLRPVAAWVTSGTVNAQDKEVLFAGDLDKDCDAGDLWHKRFELRRLPNGSTHAPSCISRFAKQLFALGKSRAFLNRLDQVQYPQVSSSLPDFDKSLQRVAPDSLVLFDQALGDAMETWISSISTDCSPVLRTKLLADHGLVKTLTALPFVFFSQDGALFQDFSDTLIERMITRRNMLESWGDKFLLTELAQNTFGSLPEVDASSIFITALEDKKQDTGSVIRKLSAITMSYKFSWPVQNITRSTIQAAHSSVFTFLLQAYHASRLLQDRFFGFRAQQSSSAARLKLRQRLLWFSSRLYDYATSTAHVLHKDMLRAMERAADIDEMVSIWSGYEKRLQTNLLLAPNLEPVRDAMLGILELSEALSRCTRDDQILALQEQFDKNTTFLNAGIRSVGRAGAGSALETLANALEWKAG